MAGPEHPNYKPGGVTGKGWQPGQSGNPGGRPKGESITATLRRLVAESEHHGRPIQEVLAEVLLKHALSGKFPFAKEILDRLDGPLNQKIKHEQERVVRIVVADARGREREVGSLRQFYDEYPADELPPGPPSSYHRNSTPTESNDGDRSRP